MTRCHKKGELTRGSSSLLLFLMFLMKTRLFFLRKISNRLFEKMYVLGQRQLSAGSRGKFALFMV